MDLRELIWHMEKMRDKTEDRIASFDENILVSATSYSKGFDQGTVTTCSLFIQCIKNYMIKEEDESE